MRGQWGQVGHCGNSILGKGGDSCPCLAFSLGTAWGLRAQSPISRQGIPGPQRPLPLRGIQGEVWQAQQEERVQRGALGDREQPYRQGLWLPGEQRVALHALESRCVVGSRSLAHRQRLVLRISGPLGWWSRDILPGGPGGCGVTGS